MQYYINEYLSLKLEKGVTNIYIQNKFFRNCIYLLLHITENNIKDYENISSIDEISDFLDKSLENNQNIINIDPKDGFWGHCSNLQAWAENDYDTRILHSNLAFPLLKKLVEAGDTKARKVFKDEIFKRFNSGYWSVILYLLENKYIRYLTLEEILSLEINLRSEDKDKFIQKIARNIERLFFGSKEIISLIRIKNVFLDLLNKLGKTNKAKILYLKDMLDETRKEFPVELSNILVDIFSEVRKDELLDLIDSGIFDYINSKDFFISLLKLENSLINVKINKKKYTDNLKIDDVEFLIKDDCNLLRKIDSSIPDSHLKICFDADCFCEEAGQYLLKDGHIFDLYLPRLDLKQLPQDFSKLDHLEILDINFNSLREIPNSLCNLKNLKELYISGNFLKELPRDIGDLKRLEQLDLSENKLNELPESVENLQNLKFLDLSNNNFYKTPETIYKLRKLRRLYLSENYIENISLKKIRNLDNLEIIKLHKNPIRNYSMIKKNLRKILPKLNIGY